MRFHRCNPYPANIAPDHHPLGVTTLMPPGGRATDVPLLRLRTADEILSMVPYMLGFHPTESLVVLVLDGAAVQVTARIDLPPVAHVCEVARMFRDLARQHGPRPSALRLGTQRRGSSRSSTQRSRRKKQKPCLLAVVYSADAERGWEFGQAMYAALGPDWLSVMLYADSERWWKIEDSTSPRRVEDGRPCAASSLVAATAVAAGLSVLPTRAELEDWVVEPAPETLERVEPMVLRAVQLQGSVGPRTRAVLVERLIEDHLGGRQLSDDELVELTVLVNDLLTRDIAWSTLERATADAHIALWRSVLALVPKQLAAPALTLLGLSCWVAGNGAVLNICIDKLLADHPGYSAVQTMTEISERAVPPSFWNSVLDGLRPELEQRLNDLDPTGEPRREPDEPAGP